MKHIANKDNINGAVAKCAHHTRQKKRLTKPFDYKQKAKIKKIQGRNSPYNEFLLF